MEENYNNIQYNINKDIVSNPIKNNIKIKEYYNIVNNYSKDEYILIKHEDNIQVFTFNLKEYILEKKNIHYISLFAQGKYLIIISFKSKKMINGIPAIFAFKQGNISTVPDDVVVGADENQIRLFFQKYM